MPPIITSNRYRYCYYLASCKAPSENSLEFRGSSAGLEYLCRAGVRFLTFLRLLVGNRGSVKGAIIKDDVETTTVHCLIPYEAPGSKATEVEGLGFRV